MEDNMEKMERKSILVFYLPWILFMLFLLYAAIGLFGFYLGYGLVLYHACLQSIIIATLLLTTVIVAFRGKITLNAREQIAITLLLPMTIGFHIYLMIMYSIYNGYTQLILCILFGVISIVSMICLFFRYRFCTPLKIIFGVFSVILMVVWLFAAGVSLCVSLFGFAESAWGEFGKTSVVKQVSSPDQNYVAEVLDIDEGALGGNTRVNIKKIRQHNQGKEISVLLGKLVPIPNEVNVYEGPWGEFEDMVIEWKDNHTLLIDGKEYTVDSDE